MRHAVQLPGTAKAQALGSREKISLAEPKNPPDISQTVTVIFSIIKQVENWLIWTSFLLGHLLVAVIALFLIWYWKIEAQDVIVSLQTLAQSHPWQLLGGIGVSLLSVAALYMKAYKSIAKRLSASFLFQKLRAQAEKRLP